MSQKPFVPTGHQLVMEVFVRDLLRSLAFYQQLGFQPVRVEGGFAELLWEEHLLFLEERKDLPAPPELPQGNIRIMVPDVDRYWELTKTMGARVVAPIENRYYGLRDFTIADPDGFGIRFGSRLH